MELWCHEIGIMIHKYNLDPGSTWFQATNIGKTIIRGDVPETGLHDLKEPIIEIQNLSEEKNQQNISKNQVTNPYHTYAIWEAKSLFHEINIIFTQKIRFTPKHIILTENMIQTKGVLASREVNQRISHSPRKSFRYQPQCELKTWWGEDLRVSYQFWETRGNILTKKDPERRFKRYKVVNPRQ